MVEISDRSLAALLGVTFVTGIVAGYQLHKGMRQINEWRLKRSKANYELAKKRAKQT
eukprot:m.25163 g.25163  ORF g.25163 m.25163 type:complete len:57 (+) comp9704_c0_seq1:43-213(+)